MRYFWPWLFSFLIVVALMLGASRPDLVDRALLYLGVYLAVAGWVLLGYAAIVGAVLLIVIARRVVSDTLRPVDGAYPLIRRRLRGGRDLYVDYNRIVSPLLIVDPVQGPIELDPAAGYDRQMAYDAEVELTNRVRAAFPGDAARRHRWGARSTGPGGGGRSWLGDGKRPALPAPSAQLAPPNLATVDAKRSPTFADGLGLSSRRSIAVGVVVDGADLVRWSLDLSPHARIHGQSQGAGKTNLAKTILAGALFRGGHAVIVDRRRFKDWSGWDRAAELVDANDPAGVVALLAGLVDLYRSRDRLLAEAGAPSISELENAPPRIFVLLAEFGALCQSLDGAGLLAPAQDALALILREAGAAGVHLVFEDQIVDRRWWPRAVVANAGAVFTGRLPLNLGAAGGYYGAHDLPAYTFHYDGSLFRSWDMAEAAGPLLDRLPAPALRLLADGSRAGSSPGSSPGSPSGSPGDSGGDPRWLDFTRAWLAARPDLAAGGTNDLARAMAEAAGRSSAEYARYKGIASAMLSRVRAEAG